MFTTLTFCKENCKLYLKKEKKCNFKSRFFMQQMHDFVINKLLIDNKRFAGYILCICYALKRIFFKKILQRRSSTEKNLPYGINPPLGAKIRIHYVNNFIHLEGRKIIKRRTNFLPRLIFYTGINVTPILITFQEQTKTLLILRDNLHIT